MLNDTYFQSIVEYHIKSAVEVQPNQFHIN